MTSFRAAAAASALSAILAGTAAAGSVDTPECRRNLAAANALIDAIAARDKEFAAGDLAKNCALLRQNLADMVKAREPMDRCLTGREHGENVGQMDASIGDVRDVLARKCGK